MSSLYSFRSYRKYLKSFLSESPENPRPITLVKLAKNFGMSPSALQMVISGQRDLTTHKVHILADALELTREEREYFVSLVHFEQAESRSERDFYRRKIESAPAEKSKALRRVSSADLLSHWYIPSLLIYFIDSKTTPSFSTAATALRIPESEVKRCFDRLNEMGILQHDKQDGHIHLVYDKLSASFPREQFMQRLVLEVQQRLRSEFRLKKSYFEAHTLNICEERYGEFVSDYKELLERYIALGPKSPDAAQIYQSFLAFVRTI